MNTVVVGVVGNTTNLKEEKIETALDTIGTTMSATDIEETVIVGITEETITGSDRGRTEIITSIHVQKSMKGMREAAKGIRGILRVNITTTILLRVTIHHIQVHLIGHHRPLKEEVQLRRLPSLKTLVQVSDNAK